MHLNVQGNPVLFISPDGTITDSDTLSKLHCEQKGSDTCL